MDTTNNKRDWQMQTCMKDIDSFLEISKYEAGKRKMLGSAPCSLSLQFQCRPVSFVVGMAWS